ncbi:MULTISPECIES: site-specific DNA-methyltransferase [Achromobacter]|uniref:Methyltransferase n=1 Tax=Achromobacter xylosoxidans (strain A8) TaxID=762376 RepID=E3HYB9_ACHXA|nr:site-specific DNA-methyltransferase [Achromobacter xylosoxidans]ADP20073.1 N-4 cytosine-specific DNA methylase [Achromobacter xylosoxidans A8]
MTISTRKAHLPGKCHSSEQLDLFQHVLASYEAAGDQPLLNADLYQAVARRAGVAATDANRTVEISGGQHSPFKRSVRWVQQTMKHLGLLERRPGQRGVWNLAQRNKDGLTSAPAGKRLVAFSTNLGIAIWGDSTRNFPQLGEPISLVVTSPPYLLRRPRAYGNPLTEQAYVDFICSALEPIVAQMAPGGSICLNLTNDSFVPGSPARSVAKERLVLALVDRLGLELMDTLIWHNPSKPPGPIQYASKRRVQLNTSYEPVYWFTTDSSRVYSDNRRVLQPHSDRHKQWLRQVQEAGACPRTGVYGDGAYRLRPSSYMNETEGRIPKNVLPIGHACADTRQYRRDAAGLGLPIHGAMMPLALARFLIEFLSLPGQLVLDLFGGTAKTAMAAEVLDRRWMIFELFAEYLRGGAQRFQRMPGFQIGKEFSLGFPGDRFKLQSWSAQ